MREDLLRIRQRCWLMLGNFLIDHTEGARPKSSFDRSSVIGFHAVKIVHGDYGIE
jgi:hypothetical protein